MTRRRCDWCPQCAADRARGPCLCDATGEAHMQSRIMALLRAQGRPMSAGEIRHTLVGPGRDKAVSSQLTLMQDRRLIRVAAGYEMPRFRKYEPMPGKVEAVAAPAKRNITPMSYRSMLARGLA